MEHEESLCRTKHDEKFDLSILMNTYYDENLAVHYELEVQEDKHFTMEVNDKFEVKDVPVGSFAVKQIDMSEWNETKESERRFLKVVVNSKDECNCGLVTIHPLNCPISTSIEESIKKGTIIPYQNMLTLGGFTIDTERFQKLGGFFIKFDVYPNDQCMCWNKNGTSTCDKGICANKGKDSKSFSCHITSYITTHDLQFEIALTTMALLAAFIWITVLFVFCSKKKLQSMTKISDEEKTVDTDPSNEKLEIKGPNKKRESLASLGLPMEHSRAPSGMLSGRVY